MKIQRAGMNIYLIDKNLVYINLVAGLIAQDVIFHKALFPKKVGKVNKSDKFIEVGLKAQVENFEIEEMDYMALLTSFSESSSSLGYNRLEIWRWKNCLLKHSSGSFGFGFEDAQEDNYHVVHREYEKDKKHQKRVYLLLDEIDFYRSENKGKLPHSISESAYKHLVVFSDFVRAEKQKIKVPNIEDKTNRFSSNEIEQYRQTVWSVEIEIKNKKVKIQYSYIPNFDWLEEKGTQSFDYKAYKYNNFLFTESKLEFFVDEELVEIKRDRF